MSISSLPVSIGWRPFQKCNFVSRQNSFQNSVRFLGGRFSNATAASRGRWLQDFLGSNIPHLTYKFQYGRFLLYTLLYVCILIMIVTLFQYITFDQNVGFLKFKQQVVGNQVWRSAFYIHVFTCFICLFAGLTQFSKWLLTNRPKFHRLVGKLYAFNIIFINFPIGLLLALYANGNLPGKIAFTILDILWFYFTVNAIKFILRGDVRRHEDNMIRSFALTLSALTLRGWKIVFLNFTTLDTSTIYIIDAWLGFSLNLVIAEMIIQRKKNLSLKPNITRNDIERHSTKN
jgi:hypothetical protein